ncbi:hypothetical protein PIB30_072769 [Stylosanthes scabra]|uniref:Uncharacterized protein n=1 Tax=Stylosanthes scabra TaxID=79078 RepID=A0ABU6VR05_9FABA|nr:hypothetical protein [Stylosanthes scabra]
MERSREIVDPGMSRMRSVEGDVFMKSTTLSLEPRDNRKSSRIVIYVTEENAITSRSLNKMGRGTVVDRKGKKNKAVVENAPSQSGTSLDSQVTLELMEVFAEKMHAFGLD